MMKVNKILTGTLILTLVLGFRILSAQVADLAHQRPVTRVKSDGWHSISLPPAVLSVLKEDLGDVRIYELTESDTTEVPYLIETRRDRYGIEETPFKMINRSTTQDHSFVTFRPEAEMAVNRIELEIEPRNFEVEATLEGSNNRLRWFTIKDHMRLIGIANDRVSYHYSTLTFSDADYKFYRVKLDDPEVEIIRATVGTEVSQEGEYEEYQVTDLQSKNDTDQKITEILVELKDRYPVGRLEFLIDHDHDFYRSVQVSYLRQTVETENGKKEIWRDFANRTLTSLEPNIFEEDVQFTNKLKIVIRNFDDIPLDVRDIKVSGPEYFLITNLKAEGRYILAYAGPMVHAPRYDMVYFKNRIPEDLVPAFLGAEEPLKDREETGAGDDSPGSDFFSEFGLWAVMILVILVLGFFTMRMMRNSKT